MVQRNGSTKPLGPAFWKIAGAGAAFQAGSSTVDTATIIASLVYQLTGNVFAVGAASAVVRLGWLLPQIVVGFLAQRARRRMPFYISGAFGRAICRRVWQPPVRSISSCSRACSGCCSDHKPNSNWTTPGLAGPSTGWPQEAAGLLVTCEPVWSKASYGRASLSARRALSPQVSP